MEERLNRDIKRIKEQIEIGNYDRAIRISNLLINSKIPKIVPHGMLYKGLALSLDKRYDEAVSILNQLIDKFPNTELAYLYRCETFIHRGEFEQAIKDVNRLITFDQYKFNYLRIYVKVNQFLGNFKNVINASSKILYFYPEHNDFLLTRAQAKGRLGLYKEALDDYKKVLKEVEENELGFNKYEISTLFNDIGYYYSKLEQFHLARFYLEKSLAFDNTHAYSLNNLGFILAQIGDVNYGLQLINESIVINSSNSYAYKNRAKLFISMGQFTKAKIDLFKAKELEYHLLYDDEVDELLNQLN